MIGNYLNGMFLVNQLKYKAKFPLDPTNVSILVSAVQTTFREYQPILTAILFKIRIESKFTVAFSHAVAAENVRAAGEGRQMRIRLSEADSDAQAGGRFGQGFMSIREAGRDVRI